MRVFIYGSCVSRDIFNTQERDLFEIPEYIARSSLASSFLTTPCDDIYSDKMSHAFQARMIKNDLQKTTSKKIKEAEFDIFLVDFIDERFNLVVFSDSSVATYSNELKSSGYVFGDDDKFITSQSDAFYQMWERGWSELVKMLQESNQLYKIVINKVFWGNTMMDGSIIEGFSLKQIEEANIFLEKLYTRCAKDLNQNQFLTFDDSSLLLDADNRWGISPFHYAPRYYVDAFIKLQDYFMETLFVSYGTRVLKNYQGWRARKNDKTSSKTQASNFAMQQIALQMKQLKEMSSNIEKYKDSILQKERQIMILQNRVAKSV